MIDKDKLISSLDATMAKYSDDPVRKVMVGLTKQVWQIDWTVAPYDIIYRCLQFDITYFYQFMDADKGDEAEENALINEWVQNSYPFEQRPATGYYDLINELIMLRWDAMNS